MRLSDVSIKKPVFAWMLMLALLVLGGIGVSRLGVSKMPDIDFPQVTVQLTFEGASPEVMETDVVDIVEDACMSVEGVKDITSSSRQGAATVTVEFQIGRNIDAALQDVQTKIAQAGTRLPKGMDPAIVTKTNPEDQPILWVALSGPRPPQFLADIARFKLRERLQTVPGVGEVMMGGYRERSVRVWIDDAKLDAFRLTVTDVISALQREHLELPAGRLESGAREVNVRTEGEALDIDQFRAIVVKQQGGAQIRLSDVAVVEDGLEDRRRIARSMGMPAQGVGVKKQRGANAVSVAKGVKAMLEKLRKEIPPDCSLDVVFDGTASVEESIQEIEVTLGLSVLLTALVCWLFLGAISSTVNVLLSIPTSIVGTFAAMYFFGFTLNTFSLLALSLAVGIVVDDSIMVLENIFRRAEEGEGRIRAAVAGTRQIAFAAMAATAAIVAIFLPVAFMKGIVGAFFFQFGVTISVCVMLSLLEALTLTPSRCAQFLSVGERTTRFGRAVERAFEGVAAAYRTALPWVLRHRWTVLGASTLVFAISLILFFRMKTELSPPQDISIFLTRIQTPVGSSIDVTDRVLKRCEEALMNRKEVFRYFGAVGGFGGGEVNTAILFVTLVPKSQRDVGLQEFMNQMRAEWGKIPGMDAFLQDISLQGFSAQRGFPVEFSIQGPDWATLAKSADGFITEMRQDGNYSDVHTDLLVGMPEAQVIPDRPRAAALGVSMDAIAQTVNALVGGVRVGKYKDKGRRYDVRARLLAGERTRPEDIGRLKVRAANGDLVPLSSLVSVEEKPSLLAITRRSRERAVTIFANVPQGKSQGDAINHLQDIAAHILPEGYRISLSGTAQTMKESFSQLAFALLFGVVIAYMILAAQFNSFAHPFTVLTALPFSLTGAVVALYIGGLTLNLYSFIGIILLMGIVKKNSILLVDFTNERKLRGDTCEQALLHACPKRLRPILMTSLSTVAGAIPAAFAAGPAAELRQPMAVAVIGGVLVSTFLTLFVVPALYSLLDGLVSRVGTAARIERETTTILADLQREEIDEFAHKQEGHNAGEVLWISEASDGEPPA